jgi:hypothetical protein
MPGERKTVVKESDRLKNFIFHSDPKLSIVSGCRGERKTVVKEWAKKKLKPSFVIDTVDENFEFVVQDVFHVFFVKDQ